MANQMVALQARAPQNSVLGPSIQRGAQMVNMMQQQRAAERQAAQAQQTLDIQAAQEARAAQTQTATMREKDLAFQENEMKRLRRIGMAILETEDPAVREAAYQNLLGLIEKTDQQLGATMRQVAGTFNAPVLRSVIMEVDNYFNKKYPTPTTETVFGPNNEILEATRGGLPGVAGVRPLINMPARGAPAPSETYSPPAPQGRGMEGPPMVEPTFRGENPPLSPYQQEHLERLKAELGMTDTPASFTRGSMGATNAVQMTPDMAQTIYDSAISTGVMAQVDFDQLLAMAPPQNRQAFVDMLQRENITLEPNAPSLAVSGAQTPQPEFAVMRGPAPQSRTADLGGAPMQQTLAQTNVIGQQAYGRSASPVSPAPGVYGVPTQAVAEKSRATRPSKEEVFETELAKIRAQRAAGPAPVTSQQRRERRTEVANAYTKTQTLLNKAYNPREGIIALASKIKMLSPDQKEAITGLSGYIPSFRASSKEADTLVGNLKGVVTALGKDAAAASGAIGPMAVQEWKIVADTIAKLDLEGMTPRALDAQMDRIIEQVRSATNLAQQVYDVQYGEDIKEYPAFKLRMGSPPKAKTPVAKGGSRISPDIENILKSQGI
jgi:hypothetical protein